MVEWKVGDVFIRDGVFMLITEVAHSHNNIGEQYYYRELTTSTDTKERIIPTKRLMLLKKASQEEITRYLMEQ